MSLKIPTEAQQNELDAISSETLALNKKHKELNDLKALNIEGSRQTIISMEGDKTTLKVLDPNSNPPNVEIQIEGIVFGNAALVDIISTIESDVLSKQH